MNTQKNITLEVLKANLSDGIITVEDVREVIADVESGQDCHLCDIHENCSLHSAAGGDGRDIQC